MSASIENATVLAGGSAYFDTDAQASGVTVSSGGWISLYPAVSAGQMVSARRGGRVSATTIIDGVTLMSGAVLDLDGYLVLSGGTLDLPAGGVVSSVVISSGGTLSGPGTLVGDDDVALGAVDGVTVGDGADVARLFIESGGSASGNLVSSAYEQVSSGGSAAATTIASGGVLDIVGHASGVADLGVVSSGGAVTVSSGGAIAGTLTLSGGLATLDAGAIGAVAVVGFAGAGGELAIASGGAFGGVVSGLGAGDKLDLGGFAYNASPSVESVAFVEAAGGLSGALTLSSGGKTEALTLIGAYATSNFALSTDKHGGTFVSWVSSGGFAPGVPGVQRLAAAMAAFTGAGAAATTHPLAATNAAHGPLLAQGR